MITPDLVTSRFVLSCLDAADVTEGYRSWMVDSQLTRYLETRHHEHTLESLRSYVSEMRSSSHSYFFGIFSPARREHYGNIKLGPISTLHSSAAVGLVIGERAMWGRGVASEVVGALTEWAFNELLLEKLYAGSYAANEASIRAFQRCGYAIEGVQRSQVRLDDGQRDDVVLLGRTRQDAGAPTS